MTIQIRQAGIVPPVNAANCKVRKQSTPETRRRQNAIIHIIETTQEMMIAQEWVNANKLVVELIIQEAGLRRDPNYMGEFEFVFHVERRTMQQEIQFALATHDDLVLQLVALDRFNYRRK